MTDTPTRFTHIGIERPTRLKISILTKVQPKETHIYELVEAWASEKWEQAKADGLVTDAMLSAHWVSPTEDGNISETELKQQDGKKLLEVVKVAKK